MLHHLSLGVLDLSKSAAFYDAVLGSLGYLRVWSDDDAIGYGYVEGNDLLALKLVDQVQVPGQGFHLAFAAHSHEQVAQFHAAALQHGGLCNGAPGLRADYGEHYYAAFVIDPDGYRLEAVINTA